MTKPSDNHSLPPRRDRLTPDGLKRSDNCRADGDDENAHGAVQISMATLAAAQGAINEPK